MMFSKSHAALSSMVAATMLIVPVEARANPAAAAALSHQITVIADAVSAGSARGVSPAQARQLQMAVKGVVEGAVASGLSYQQISWAVSQGLAQSQAGAMATELANTIAVAAYDTWVAVTATVEGATLPSPLLWIILDNPSYVEMAHVWMPYPDGYYGDGYEADGYADAYGDYYGYGDERSLSGDESDADHGSSTSGNSSPEGEGEGGDNYSPGGDRPHTQYDSSQHAGGYWTDAGCFPPTPDVHWLHQHQVMVPCSGDEAPAPMMLVDVRSASGDVIGSQWVSTIPLGGASEALLLMPMVGSDAAPTIVHWF